MIGTLAVRASATSATAIRRKVVCSTGVPIDAIEETVTAGNSSPHYDVSGDQYSYAWKTDMGWGGTCRELDVRLDDGSTHTAVFQFK